MHQNTGVCGGQDAMDVVRDDENVFPEERCPFRGIVNGNPVRRNVVQKWARDVAGAIDNESNIVVAHKMFALCRLDRSDPDAIQDLSWREHRLPQETIVLVNFAIDTVLMDSRSNSL